MAFPCDAPATAVELLAYAPEVGVYRDEYRTLDELVDVLGGEDCPYTVTDYDEEVVDTDGCETSSGYWIEADRWGWGEGFGYQDFVVSATERADGSLPTGRFAIGWEWGSSGYVMGSEWRSVEADWELDDAAGWALRDAATLRASFGDTWGYCTDDGSAWFETEEDGCPFEGTWLDYGGDEDQATFTGATWTLVVETSRCGSTTATLDGVRTFVDPDTWAVVDKTDCDGDGCALEDCDCDDGDPGVNPTVYDVNGDGVDANCDGADNNGDACAGVDTCTSVPGDACPPPADTAPPEDTAPAEDTAPPRDTASPADTAPPEDTGSPDTGSPAEPPGDTGDPAAPPPSDVDPRACGCASTGSPAWLGLLLSAFAARRRATRLRAF